MKDTNSELAGLLLEQVLCITQLDLYNDICLKNKASVYYFLS